MIYTAIDWSGSPGPRHGEFIVFAALHLDETVRHIALEQELASVKAFLRQPAGFVFKHDQAAPLVRECVFEVLSRLTLQAHVYRLDKRLWKTANPTGSGNVMLEHGILRLVTTCPDRLTARGVLLIDPPSASFVTGLRTPINRAFRERRRTGFRSIRGLQDTHPD